jgi:beta-glucosidase
MSVRETDTKPPSELVTQMTLEEKASLTVGRDVWTTTPIDRLGIPSIWVSDGPNGVRKPEKSTDIGMGGSTPATCFPTESALASSWDLELVEEVGAAIGEECQALGVQVILGPGVNLKRSPLGGRNFEYFSEDPVLTGEMAAAYIKGVQSQGVGTSLKHFATNEQESGRMYANSVVDERTLRELYLRAFEIAVRKAAPWTVMSSYNLLNGTYTAEHRWLLHEVLKQEWGHPGIVVSDWFGTNDRVAGLDAGLHLQMPGGPTVHLIVDAVKSGRLEEGRLDEIVRELLQIILQADAARRPETVQNLEQHHELARRAASESIVLLKNEGNLLPLQNVSRLAVIGAFAKEPRYQGAGSSRVTTTRVDNAHDELVRLLEGKATVEYAPGYGEGLEPDASLIEEATRIASQAEVAVVFVGLPDSEESEGVDRPTFDLPAGHNALVEAALEVQPRTVVVLTNGSSVALPWEPRVPAIVEGWLTGQAGGAAMADVLTGSVNPSGKLSETFPVRLEDTPPFPDFPANPALCLYGERLWIGYRWYDARRIEPRFPFGHGFSYTSFEYSDLRLDPESLQEGQTLTVSCTVQNSGSRAGREVVQLYVREQAPKIDRPNQELRGFASISLQPGERGRVSIPLDIRDFAVYDPQASGWITEGGTFNLLVGASSRDICLEATVEVAASGPRARLTELSSLRSWMESEKGLSLLQPYLDAARKAMEARGEPVNEQTMMWAWDLPVSKLQLMGVITPEVLAQLVEQAAG